MEVVLHKRPAYSLINNMVARCHNPRNPRFSDYGGRGIKVCDEWRWHRAAFVAWAEANGFGPGMQIDRIDNDGPYCPANCRFVTPLENSKNRRNTRRVTAFGETKRIDEWLLDERCNARTSACLQTRLKRGMSPEQALSRPFVVKYRATLTCPICGTSFVKKHSTAETCSRSCGTILGHKRRSYT